MRHRLLFAVAVFVAVVATASHASAIDPPLAGTPATQPTGSTKTFLDGVVCPALIILTPPGSLPVMVKSMRRVDNNDGSATLEVTVTGDVPATFTTAGVFDCVWIDKDNDGVRDVSINPAINEPALAYLAGSVPITGTSPARSVKILLTVPGGAGKWICDRAAGASFDVTSASSGQMSALVAGSGLLFLSNKVCLGPEPDPVVPESPLVAALTGTAILTVGLALLWHRRRPTALAV
jgi:hypothetical protein